MESVLLPASAQSFCVASRSYLPHSVCFPLLFRSLGLFFMCVWILGLFSAIYSLPWHLAIIKGCPDHHIFSKFNFQNCLNSSEPQSLWSQASRGLPVLPSLCIPTPPLLCGSNTFMAETFSILSENVMNFEMI